MDLRYFTNAEKTVLYLLPRACTSTPGLRRRPPVLNGRTLSASGDTEIEHGHKLYSFQEGMNSAVGTVATCCTSTVYRLCHLRHLLIIIKYASMCLKYILCHDVLLFLQNVIETRWLNISTVLYLLEYIRARSYILVK